MKLKLLHGLIIGFCTATFFSIIYALGFFGTWQDLASDKIFPSRPVSNNIVIIEIDNASIEELGRWPWSRSVFAQLLSNISKANPDAIGIDVAFLETETEETDNQLAAVLSNLDNVTLAGELDGDRVYTPIPVLETHARTGIANITPNTDGVARLAPLSAHAKDGKVYDHFALSVVKSFYENQGITKDLSQIPTEQNMIRINYAAPPNSFKSYSFSDTHEGRVPPANFKDKIVLIGATAPDLHDNQITPVSNGVPMNGVEIHANIIQSILENRYIYPEINSVTIATIFIFSIFLAVFLMFIPFYLAIFITFATLVAYIFYAILSFDGGVIRNITVVPLAIFITGTIDIVYRYFSEFSQKRFIKKALSYYLSDSVMAEVLSHPDKLTLGGTRQELSVLFSDIAGFTSISEKLDPEDLAHILNSYLTRMTNIVFRNNGVLDKYIGDAVMAFWGAPLKDPNHAYLACKSAIEMFDEMNSIHEDWKKYGIHDFDIRIGINTGDMVVGNMGSEVRFDYTLLGDNVNLGSRLEGINKAYGTKIIISHSTYEKVKGRVSVRKLDKVAVKGKKTGVTIYELRGLNVNDDVDLLENFESARLLYEKGKFKTALSKFAKLAKDYPNDNPIRVYIERTKELIKHPPKSWDGIYRATSK